MNSVETVPRQPCGVSWRAHKFKPEGYVIGGNQIDQTAELILAAEDPDPGLVHPIPGTLLVACVKLKTKIEYLKDIRELKLEFEFIEAEPARTVG